MQSQVKSGVDFARIVDAYPHQAALIRRLLLSDPSFREVCLDFLIVLDMIADFESKATTGTDGMPQDYVLLGTELQRDIAMALSRATERLRQ